MNCLIYARVSTERQAEKDLSLPAQLQAMREHAKRQGWTVIQEFVEPGHSAWRGRRPTFEALLARCRQQPKVNVVLTHKLDRFARNLLEYLSVKALLKREGVRLVSLSENLDDSSAAGQLLENIMAAMAEHYSRNLSDEAKKGMLMKVERGGWPHKPPRGYVMTRDEHGRSVPVPDERTAPLIRQVFERYATGFVSLKQLRLEAAASGLRGLTGKPLAVSYLRQMLENPFYVGRLRWNGREYPGRHQPVIDEALFVRVQRAIRERHVNTGEKGRLRFMLRGVAYCSGCGARLTAERHGQWAYYRCVRHTVSKALCGARFSNADTTHAQLLKLYRRLHVPAALKRLILAEAEATVLRRTVGARQEVNSARMQLIRLEERAVRLGDAYASGEMPAPVYRALAQKDRTERARLNELLQRGEADPKRLIAKVQRVVENADSLLALHAGLADDEARQRLARIVFSSISLARARIVDYTLRAPFDRLLRENDDAHDLELQAVTAAIKNILEFDLVPLQRLIVQAIQTKAA